MAIKSAATDSRRLDPESWIVAAIDLLAEQGIDGVRVELLARRLGVTKGSFYWHFRHRDALHQAMLDWWGRRATLDIIARLDRDDEPMQRFRSLMRLPLRGPRSFHAADVELAVRLWGRRDARARAALEKVDQLRTEYIAQVLVACGVPVEQSHARAILAYSYMRISRTLVEPDDDTLMSQCEAILSHVIVHS